MITGVKKRKKRKGPPKRPKGPLAVPNVKGAPKSEPARESAPRIATHAARPSAVEAKAASDLISNFTQILARINEASRAFQSTVEAHIAAENVPRALPCPVFEGEKHRVDVEATCAKSWHGRPQVIPVYRPCIKCRAAEVGRAEIWLHKAGAPKIFLKASLENWVPRLASDHWVLRQCREFIGAPSGLLVLQGGVGLGKTHLGVAILRALGAGRMMTQTHFLLMLRQTYRSELAPHPVEACCAAKALVLDELGQSEGGRDEFPALYEVLNHRYGEGKPTVITTNVTVEQWAAAFGDRIADRLVLGRICLLKGESWRGKTITEALVEGRL